MKKVTKPVPVYFSESEIYSQIVQLASLPNSSCRLSKNIPGKPNRYTLGCILRVPGKRFGQYLQIQKRTEKQIRAEAVLLKFAIVNSEDLTPSSRQSAVAEKEALLRIRAFLNS